MEAWENAQSVPNKVCQINSERQLKWHILDVFSALFDQIELIPFTTSQASWDTKFDYPLYIIPIILKINLFKG